MQESAAVATAIEDAGEHATHPASPPRRRGRHASPAAPSPVAQELRRRREMLHLTVRAAAARTGVPPSVISEIESGHRERTATPGDGYAPHGPSTPTGCSSTADGTFGRSSASMPATTTGTGPTRPATRDHPAKTSRSSRRSAHRRSAGKYSAG